MNPKWAEDNLQTIRTLMERSALYRRALAPVMLVCGIAGLAGGVVGWLGKFDSYAAFVAVWAGTAVFALSCSLLLMRRQALKDSEPFWSAPTRRIAQAMTPSFLIGAVISVLLFALGDVKASNVIAVLVWCLMYGCGIHAAGFFMPRGIRWFGWVFILVGLVLVACLFTNAVLFWEFSTLHLLMAAIFGGLHLAYGIYLYFTEKKNTAA
jgi:hypothetical protein